MLIFYDDTVFIFTRKNTMLTIIVFAQLIATIVMLTAALTD
ncbi:hypothetical protein [Undibacterium hunanense]|nr:hypothetical protein [Undibacterium hunanense]